jgi:transposase
MYECTQKIIKNKVGLLNLAEELGNVSRACKVMGFSRDTFYRYKSAVEEGGIESLLDKSRRQPNLKNRTDETTEKAILDYAIECPAHGQARTSNELRKRGVFISPGGVRCIWLRHNLASFKDRLNALEKKSAEEGLLLTENQIAALERKKDDDLACGEIETAHPGYTAIEIVEVKTSSDSYPFLGYGFTVSSS